MGLWNRKAFLKQRPTVGTCLRIRLKTHQKNNATKNEDSCKKLAK
jgi:hypothetical protein